MGYVYMLFGFSTVWLFMYKMEWLMNRKSYWVNIGYDAALYGIALALLHMGVDHQKFVVALKIPLISSVVFRVLYLAFRKIYRRNPENTFWVFSKKPIEDIVFTGLFWVLGAGLPIILAKFL